MKQLQNGIYAPSIGEASWGDEVNQNFENLDSLIGNVRDAKAKCDLLASKIQNNTALINNTKDSLQEDITNAVNDLQEKINALSRDLLALKARVDNFSNTGMVDHTHDNRYYQKAEIDAKLDEKSNTGHNHDNRYYQKTEIDVKLDEKSNTYHTHDDRYYTESEINTKLVAKANTDHTHDDRYYTESEINIKLDKKSNIDHTHSQYLTGITKSMVTSALGYTPPAQDTNTTYRAGSNLSLSDTTFNVSSDPSFNSVSISGYKLSIG